MHIHRSTAFVFAIMFVHGVGVAEDKPPADFPPGRFTPVFNEVTISFAIVPERPAPDAELKDIPGPTEQITMVNKINKDTGIVEPTIFIRGETTLDASGRRTQTLMLSVDSGVVTSKLFGGQLTMYVRPPTRTPVAASVLFADFPKLAVEKFIDLPPDAAMPERYSVGRIVSVHKGRAFPAKISVPVYYSFVSGGKDGLLETKEDNFTANAKEPHPMESVVMSIPPSPDDCIQSKAWHLVDESAFLKLWIRVDCFRFLGPGDFEHYERLEYAPSRRE